MYYLLSKEVDIFQLDKQALLVCVFVCDCACLYFMREGTQCKARRWKTGPYLKSAGPLAAS